MPDNNKRVTQGEFASTMTAIQKTLNQMQETNQAEFARVNEEIARGRRVQEAILKTLNSIKGRLKETADHEERITKLEDKVFALETKV